MKFWNAVDLLVEAVASVVTLAGFIACVVAWAYVIILWAQ